MKRRISLLLVFVLLLGTVVACAPKNDDAETPPTSGQNEETPIVDEGIKETISVQVESSWREYYEAAAARVKEAHPEATIEFIEIGSFDHLDVLDQTDVTNEDVADVFAIPADRIYGLSQNEALSAIDAKAMAANLGGFADYDAGLGGNFAIDGEYLAFPMNIETLIGFVNASNAEANGIDITQPIEMNEVDFENVLIPVFDAWFGVSTANAGEIELLGKDASGNLFSDMTKDYADLEPAQKDVIEGLFNYWKAHKNAGTPLFDADAAWGYMDGQFETGGKTAVRIEGPWSTGSLSDLASNGEDLVILPIGQITLNGHPLSHWKGGWGLAVNARVEGNDEKMLLAQAMIEEIVNPEYAVDFFKATGKILENVTAQDYLNSNLPDVDKAVIEAVLESYEDAPARPLFTEWGQVWDTWKNAILSWNSVNPGTPEAAYQELQASFNAMMANY
ncbi:MAG: ABC transporter substrate-binding protein [Tissierellaceae bacterium]|nr:ABC transporter substrate-binding protein [Tissierellaceae bacterium]